MVVVSKPGGPLPTTIAPAPTRQLAAVRGCQPNRVSPSNREIQPASSSLSVNGRGAWATGAAASAVRPDPLPAHQRAAILEAAAHGPASRHHEFARSVPAEGAEAAAGEGKEEGKAEKAAADKLATPEAMIPQAEAKPAGAAAAIKAAQEEAA